MISKPFMVVVVMSQLWLSAFLEAVECPLGHLIVGCNRDGIPDTADDRELFVDCLQKYRRSGDPNNQWLGSDRPLDKCGMVYKLIRN